MQLFLLILQAVIVVLKYHLDPARIKERKDLEINEAIDQVGVAIHERRLRFVSRLIDIELRKGTDRNPSG